MPVKDQPAAKPRKERKGNADMRRRQLIEATLRSVEAHGLAKTTLATVAAEAGLSQGVAVFYYKSKTGLLVAALEDLYQAYEAHWHAALEAAGTEPKAQLLALIEADFDASICNPSMLAVWYAYWGEQSFSPQYAAISQQFSSRRSAAIEEVCQSLVGDGNARAVARWIDTLTDGYWHRIHLGSSTREAALADTLAFLARILPGHY